MTPQQGGTKVASKHVWENQNKTHDRKEERYEADDSRCTVKYFYLDDDVFRVVLSQHPMRGCCKTVNSENFEVCQVERKSAAAGTGSHSGWVANQLSRST